jgi:hypothetical protein
MTATLLHTCIKTAGDKHVFMQIQKGQKCTCYNKNSDKVLLSEPINITAEAFTQAPKARAKAGVGQLFPHPHFRYSTIL